MRFIITLLLTLLIAYNAQADTYTNAFKAADAKNWKAAFNAAKLTGKNYMYDYILWRKLRNKAERGTAKQILNFMQNYPEWPDMKRLKNRAAEALLLEGYNMSDEHKWRKLSGYRGDLFDYAWINGSFNSSEQKRLMIKYSKKLNHKLYEARADRLLWDNEATRATPLLIHTSKTFRNIGKARIAYITRARDAKRALNKLSRKQRNNPALLFARINYHKKKKQHRSAESLLKKLPSAVPHGDKWWKLWRYYAREAVGKKRYRDAYNILRPITKAEQGTQAQLFWLRGWIQLQLLNRPAQAYKDFYKFHEHVSTPVSQTRGAFWAGLAAQKNGNNTISRNWFAEAAKYPMTFYGQLAKLKQSNATTLPIRTDRISSRKPPALRKQLPLILKLAKYKQTYSVESFLLNLAKNNQRPEYIRAITETAVRVGSPHLKVRIGKNYFAKTGKWLQPISHPIPKLPRGLAVEPALVLAISRQESEFNPRASSSANAKGMMQLLPSTARLVAKENAIKHTTSMLANTKHNMKLGSLYLASLIAKFDGAYPLAIASYNAGPARVIKWQKQFGKFPRDMEGQLKWLEQIPFSETRNYVQRVLENLQTYRKLLGENTPLTQRNMFGK